MQFDKDVPAPCPTETRVSTLRSMEIGDSFAIDRAEAQPWRNAMSLAQRTGEFHFISRTVEGGKVRIWRKA